MVDKALVGIGFCKVYARGRHQNSQCTAPNSYRRAKRCDFTDYFLIVRQRAIENKENQNGAKMQRQRARVQHAPTALRLFDVGKDFVSSLANAISAIMRAEVLYENLNFSDRKSNMPMNAAQIAIQIK